MLYTEETYRARTYIALYSLIGPLALAAFAGYRTPAMQPELTLFAALALATTAVVFVVLRFAQVRIDQHGVVLKTIVRSQTFSWADVRSIYVDRRQSGRSRNRVIVFDCAQGEYFFRTGLYSRQSLQAICSAALELAPQARKDEQVLQFAQGNFPWYIR